jgi:spore coat protein U-like protein
MCSLAISIGKPWRLSAADTPNPLTSNPDSYSRGSNMLRIKIAPIAAASLLAFAGSAQAATKTASFTVSASVAANCFVSAANMNFGAYSGVAALTAASDVTVRCTNGWNYALELSAGSGNYNERKLTGTPSGTLGYNLYTDAAYTTVWGNGTASTSTVTGTGRGLSKDNKHTVHGRLPDSAANQDAPVGTYSDTIVVTVVY